MISRPVAVFAVVSSATIGSMIYAHLSQKWDIAAMHEGVLRDRERERAWRRQQRESAPPRRE